MTIQHLISCLLLGLFLSSCTSDRPDPASNHDINGDATQADVTDVGHADRSADIATLDSGRDSGDDSAIDTAQDLDPDAFSPPINPLNFDALRAALEGEDLAEIDRLMTYYDMPVCAEAACLVVTQVDLDSIAIAGDFTEWEKGATLTVTGPWHWIILDVTPQPWIEYKFIDVDDNWIMDPFNLYLRLGLHGPNSAIFAETVGRLTAISEVYSPELDNTRSVLIYLPAAYFEEPERDFPIFYLQDGANVFTRADHPGRSWEVDQTADRLFSTGAAEPAILAGITTSARMDEYTWTTLQEGGYDVDPKLLSYSEFLVHTLMPLVSGTYRTDGRAFVGGASLGGSSSLWITWQFAEKFVGAACMSSSFWVGHSRGIGLQQMIMENSRQRTPDDLRIYLDSGDTGGGNSRTYSQDGWVLTDWGRNALIAQGWDNQAIWDTDTDLSTPPENLPPSTPPDDVPQLVWETGMDLPDANLVSLVGQGHGHNEAAWRARFGEALRFLLPPTE
jgi:enterochelin esterase-like enzyme